MERIRICGASDRCPEEADRSQRRTKAKEPTSIFGGVRVLVFWRGREGRRLTSNQIVGSRVPQPGILKVTICAKLKSPIHGSSFPGDGIAQRNPAQGDEAFGL